MKTSFLNELRTQRWDDHRYYHHSRINQSLHLVSAISFVIAYGLLFVDPAQREFHDVNATPDMALNQLPYAVLNPGKDVLAKTLARFR